MKKYTLQDTDNRELARVVDRKGDWREYYHGPTKSFLRGITTVLDIAYPKGRGFYVAMKNATAEEWDKKLEVAGERGDRIHQAIRDVLITGIADRSTRVLSEDGITEVPLDDDQWGALLAFGEFWNRHECELITQDRAVFNTSRGYAGTLDAIVKLHKECGIKACGCKGHKGKTILVDWKSSKNIYDSYGAQVAAYKEAWELENTNARIDCTGIVRVGTSHKTTGGYEFVVFDGDETKRYLTEWHDCLFLASRGYKPLTEADLTIETPDVLKLHVAPREQAALKKLEKAKEPIKAKTSMTDKKKAKKPTKKAPKKSVHDEGIDKGDGHVIIKDNNNGKNHTD